MPSTWKLTDSIGIVLFPFAANSPFELSLNSGDVVRVVGESNDGWLKGYLNYSSDGSKAPTPPPARFRGMFPLEYVHILPSSSPSSGSTSTSTTTTTTTTTTTAAAAGGGVIDHPREFVREELKRRAAKSQQQQQQNQKQPKSLTGGSGGSDEIDSSDGAIVVDVVPTTAPKSLRSLTPPGSTDPTTHSMIDMEDPLSLEILQVLREWSQEKRKLLEDNRISEYERVSKKMEQLVSMRRTLLYLIVEGTAGARTDFEKRIMALIEEGSRTLNLDVIIRVSKGKNKGKRANEENTAIVELFRMYREIQKREDEMQTRLKRLEETRKANERRNKRRRRKQDGTPTKTDDSTQSLPEGMSQLLLSIKASIVTVGEPIELYFSLYSFIPSVGSGGSSAGTSAAGSNSTGTASASASKGKLDHWEGLQGRFLTEEFRVDMTAWGMPRDERLIGNLSTLFKDIPRDDFRGMWLVCRIFRKGKFVLDTTTPPPTAQMAPSSGPNTASSQNAEAFSGLEKDVYRRPLGCTVLPLGADVVSDRLMGDREYCPEMLNIYTTKEEMFFMLHERLMQGNMNSVEILPQNRALGIAVGLTHFQGEYSDVIKRHPHLASTNVCTTPQLTFPDVPSPGDKRNDLYIVLESAQFPTDTRNLEISAIVKLTDDETPQNCIRRFAGRFDTSVDTHRTAVYSRMSLPIWNEIIRIDLPPEKIEKAVLVFLFSSISPNKPGAAFAGMASLPLMGPNGVLIDDQAHTVPIFKYQKGIEDNLRQFESDTALKTKLTTKFTLKVRTKLVSTRMTHDVALNNLLKWKEVAAAQRVSMEQVLDRFTFCELAELIKFLREIFEALYSILASENNEKVAFLVYKALLILIGAVISQRQFEKYKTLMDEYISKHFSSGVAFYWLLKCFASFLDKHDDRESLRILTDSMQAISYVWEFIVRSHEQFRNDPSNPDCKKIPKSFKFIDEVRQVMLKLNKFICKKEPATLIAAQSKLLRFTSTFFDSLALIFSDKKDLGEVTRDFLKAVPRPNKKNNVLQESKLIAIKNVVNSEVFKHAESRNVVLPIIFNELKLHFGQSSSELALSIQVACEMLDSLQKGRMEREEPDSSIKEALWATLDLFPAMINAMQLLTTEIASTRQKRIQVKRPISMKHSKRAQQRRDKRQVARSGFWGFSHNSPGTTLDGEVLLLDDDEDDELFEDEEFRKIRSELQQLDDRVALLEDQRSELASGLLCIMYMLDKQTLFKYFEKSPSEERYDLLRSTLAISRIFITDSPFPEHWISFCVFSLHNVSEFIMYITEFLIAQSYHRNPLFTAELWDDVLMLLIQFISNKRLALELFSLSKQNKILSAHGDMRITLMKFLSDTWRALDVQQQHFIPKLVEPILNLMQIGKREINDVAMAMYFAMLQREFSLDGKFKQIEAVTANQLDRFIHEEKFEGFDSFFLGELDARFAGEDNAALKQEGLQFIHHLRSLVQLVIAMQKYSDTQEEEKTSACLTVMNYCLSNKDEQLYFKYVQRLSTMHLNLNNHIEASVTLLLHADKLGWRRDVILPKFEDIKQETEKERKERLYGRIIELLREGKDYERAIKLAKELARVYETETYEFKKLADVHRIMEECFRSIVTTNRFFAAYYWVAYYGKGFDGTDLRNKQFVYRGGECERNVDFIARIKKKWPNSEILKPKVTPSPEQIEGDGQYIQIDTVQPTSRDAIKGIKTVRPVGMPFKIHNYNINNNVEAFFVTRTYKKDPPPGAKPPPPPPPGTPPPPECRELFTDITFFMTKGAYPTIERRLEVVEMVTVTQSPIENAIRNVEDRCPELEEQILSHQEDERPDMNKISMLLTGMIDAPINGGLMQYIDAFFSQDYIQTHPDHGPLLIRLQQALKTQLRLLGEGLWERRRHATGASLALSDHLEALFVRLQGKLEEPLNRDLNKV